VVKQLLDLASIDSSRMQLQWVSAAEGQLFADYVAELSDLIGKLGPFKPADFKLELTAAETVLKSTRIRWLIGMDRQITEQENVYHEKVDSETYQRLVSQAVVEEYQKGLILNAIGNKPRSVREMANKTGLPVYTVSLRLNDLEKSGQAHFQGFEGTTAKFVRMAA